MMIENPPAEVSGDVLMLGTSPYPVYLLKGEGAGVLVEGTIGAMGPMVAEQLEKFGVPLGYVRRVLVTHAHPDHVMALPMFRNLFPGAIFTASELAAKTLQVEKAVGFFAKIDGMLTESLLKSGVIGERHRPTASVGATIPIDETVVEGDTIETAGLSLKVMATPGHSDCSTSFFEPGRRILVSADVTPYYISAHDYWWPNYFTGYAAYVASMERMAALDAEVVCLGHTATIRGADEAKGFFQRAMAATEAYHGRIVSEAKAGRPAADIANGLADEVFEKLPPLLPLDFFQKNCGLLVKQSLKHAGVATS
ncbi:MAG TPA: MBL fold metallo-hydrolase [Verrucomicrobiae bacterium]|nr:MBL fold metallo-hydrolase [Verrucomicrobiae bacterium]